MKNRVLSIRFFSIIALFFAVVFFAIACTQNGAGTSDIWAGDNVEEVITNEKKITLEDGREVLQFDTNATFSSKYTNRSIEEIDNMSYKVYKNKERYRAVELQTDIEIIISNNTSTSRNNKIFKKIVDNIFFELGLKTGRIGSNNYTYTFFYNSKGGGGEFQTYTTPAPVSTHKFNLTMTESYINLDYYANVGNADRPLQNFKFGQKGIGQWNNYEIFVTNDIFNETGGTYRWNITSNSTLVDFEPYYTREQSEEIDLIKEELRQWIILKEISPRRNKYGQGLLLPDQQERVDALFARQKEIEQSRITI